MSAPLDGVGGRSNRPKAVPAPRRNSRRLSPAVVRAKTFTRAPLSRRGYNPDEVDRFIEMVADDIARSDAEKADLRAEIERLRTRFRDQIGDVDRPAPGTAVQRVPVVNVEAVNLISRAQQQADQQVAQAQEYVRRLITHGRQQYEQMLQLAQQRAAEAASQAEQMMREQRSVGPTPDGEALERRIAWLKTFAEVTQVQLKSVLEALTREVEKLGEVSELSAETAVMPRMGMGR